MEKSLSAKIPGTLLCAVIAGASSLLAGLRVGGFPLEVVGAPVFAILAGMVITLIRPALADGAPLRDGIRFTSRVVPQWAVVLLGFSLDLGTIAATGRKSLPAVAASAAVSLAAAWLVWRALDMDGTVAALIGVGSSIGGGTGIVAAAPVLGADDGQVAQSFSVLFLFNVLAVLTFPALGRRIGLGPEGFAVFAGAAVNDTAAVTAAASAAESIYGVDGILSAAVTVKLTRTLAIIPITLALALWRVGRAKRGGGEGASFSVKRAFPFFILYFLAAALVTTLVGVLPEGGLTALYSGRFVPAAKWLAKFLISMAMCAIGLNTNLAELVKTGGKPIALGFCCWAAEAAVSIGAQLATTCSRST